MNTNVPRFRWLFVVAIAAVGLIGWATSSATSAPKGLTKAKAKKLFYTKKAADKRFLTPSGADARYLTQSQADGRYLTPSQGDAEYLTQAEGDARYLTQADADSRYLAADGVTTLQASPLTWEQTNGAFTGIVQRDSAGISVLTGPPSNATVQIGPTLPSELAGREMELVAVNACYNNGTGSTLTQVRVNLTDNSTALPSTSSPVEDATDRTDDACRDYVPATPVALGPTDTVGLEFDISFAGGGGNSFSASRATFYLQPG